MRQILCIAVLFALATSTLSILPPRIVGMDKCVTEYDVGEDFETRLQSDPVPLLRDLNTRCYAACILKSKNILNADGTLNVAQAIEDLPKDALNRQNIIEVYNRCAHEAGEDDCETAYKTILCLITKKVEE